MRITCYLKSVFVENIRCDLNKKFCSEVYRTRDERRDGEVLVISLFITRAMFQSMFENEHDHTAPCKSGLRSCLSLCALWNKVFRECSRLLSYTNSYTEFKWHNSNTRNEKMVMRKWTFKSLNFLLSIKQTVSECIAKNAWKETHSCIGFLLDYLFFIPWVFIPFCQ